MSYFLNTKALLCPYDTLLVPFLCYCIIAAFLCYCIIASSNAHQSPLQLSFTLQKKAIRIITFASFIDQSGHLFKDLNVIKLSDIITLQLAVFMYKFHYQLLPTVFNAFYDNVRTLNRQNLVVFASNLCYSKSQNKLWDFNIMFEGAKV